MISVQVIGDTRPKAISFQLSVVSYESRTSPSWRERSDRRIWWRGVTIHRTSRCFVTCRLVPPAWIYDQVHPGGSAATEGSGGVE
ncbi:MAG: hypothetical protein FWF18_02630 [Dehalococcoidia bacterium]|nr:hypothetical protein [Dehalococcoidia bacterium]